MPCSRHNSGTGVPAWACLSTAMIWLSVKRDFFIGTSSGKRTRKFHFWRQLTCGGITNGLEQGSGQPAITHGAVVALDVGVLLRLAWLDVIDLDIVLFRPSQ